MLAAVCEGASKLSKCSVNKCNTEYDARMIAFSVANSPLVKTAISGDDPNWCRLLMALWHSGVEINLDKLSIRFGNFLIIQNGKLDANYDESEVAEYMRNQNIEIDIDISSGSKNFTVYTMDFTKKYIEINADYRS